jgi:hypothetical protein
MIIIGLIIILLMGADDWRTREFATSCYDIACKHELMPYELDKFAFENKDLEIQHRAEKVLRNYYCLDYHGNVKINEREFVTKEPIYTRQGDFDLIESSFVKKKLSQGWLLHQYWDHAGLSHAIFVRK